MGGLSIEARNQMAAERRTLSLLIGDLERKGFIHAHACVLARMLISHGIKTTDGIRFELSGKLTSIFDERGDKRRIVGQVERS